MTDLGGVPAGEGAYRIGDTEREAAVAALDVHRQAGRLDAVEFEDRQVRVSRARTWTDIQPLFADLPGPHPVGMPSAAGPVRPSVAPVGAGAPVAPPPSEGVLGGVVPHRYRASVMALTPFAALLLFLSTDLWEWFLLIPVMSILLYGRGGSRTRPERIARDERRRIRRDQRRGY